MLTDVIYYVDQEILKNIDKDFVLIETNGFYQLLQNKFDQAFWRLDNWDKYQERYLVKLDTRENWTNYDPKELQIGLLKNARGVSDKKCIWYKCERFALNGLVYCEIHAYEDMGIRK